MANIHWREARQIRVICHAVLLMPVAQALRALVIYVGFGLCLSGATLAAVLDDDDLMLLDFTLDRQILASSVTAYSRDESVLASLAEVGAALEFPIVVDGASGRAKGWFIRPDRIFELNAAAGTVTVAGTTSRFAAGDVVIHNEAIFVKLETLSSWFPVDLRLQRTTLSVSVEPREALPAQDRIARRRGAPQLGGTGPAKLPLVEAPYRFLGAPVADVGLGYSIRRAKDKDNAITGLSYSALIAGDVAWMDGKVYLSGSDKQALSNARFTLSRDNLNLPLGLRYVELGDILPVSIPGMPYSGLERGLLIQGGGSAIGRDDLISGDSMNVAGDALPGWDVELFQNGMRVGFQTVGEDGRYDFRDLLPVSGENEFELVFYGPSGERRTERVTRYSGMQPDQPGSVRYQFSVSEKGKQLYEPDVSLAEGLSNRGTARVSAGVDVRILPRLSVRGAWNSLVVNGERLNYQLFGIRAGLMDATLGIDAIRDPLGGTRWDSSLQLPAGMKFWGFDTRITHTHYAQTTTRSLATDPTQPEYTGELTDYDLKLSSRTGITLNGPIGPAMTRFSYFHNREEGRSSNTLSAGFTSRFQRLSFGNTLNFHQFGEDKTTGLREEDRLDGNLFFSTSAYPLSVRGGAYYTLRPDTKVRQYFVDSTLRVAPDMTMQFGVSHLPETGVTRYVSGLNWQLPQVTLSPRITYDSNGDYSGFIYASFSLAPRPDRMGLFMSGRSMAETGAVVARSFIDNDGDGAYGPGDKPLPGVTIRAPQAYRTGKTGDDGVAYLTSMPNDRVTDITLDETSLPSAAMTSTHAGNSVRPRATAPVLIDFPVVPTGEIEGHVFRMRNGLREPFPGVMVELRDGDGEVVAFKVAAHDGYFLFNGVPYDTYTVELAGDLRSTASPVGVVMGREQQMHLGINIVSRRSEQATTREDVRPVVATPQPASTVAAPPAPPAPVQIPRVVTPPVMDKRSQAQLGAFGSRENALRHMNGIVMQGILQGSEMEIAIDAVGPRAGLHRVLAQRAGLSSAALCQSLKARGVQCMPVVQ